MIRNQTTAWRNFDSVVIIIYSRSCDIAPKSSVVKSDLEQLTLSWSLQQPRTWLIFMSRRLCGETTFIDRITTSSSLDRQFILSFIYQVLLRLKLRSEKGLSWSETKLTPRPLWTKRRAVRRSKDRLSQLLLFGGRLRTMLECPSCATVTTLVQSSRRLQRLTSFSLYLS